MRIWKKHLALLCVLAMIAALLSGCGGTQAGSAPSAASAPAATASEAEAPAQPAEPEEATSAEEPEPEEEPGPELTPEQEHLLSLIPEGDLLTFVELPLAEKTETLSIYLGIHSMILSMFDDLSDMPLYRQLEEDTGVHLEFTAVNGMFDDGTVLNLMIAADIIVGDYRDVFFEAPFLHKPTFSTASDYETIIRKLNIRTFQGGPQGIQSASK